MAGALSHINGNFIVQIPHRSISNCLSSSSHKPMIVLNQSYWTSINADIEAHLKQAIPVRPPLTVFEPMDHLVFATPKNTAPALCVATCELVGGHRDQAVAAAAALHLMHAATYTHEHLPLTDRPKPMTPHAFGPNIELLIGDGMMPFGFELLSRSDDPAQNNSDRILRVIIEISRAMGSQGIIDGQCHEIQCSQLDGGESCHVELIKEVCEKKEGELHACGAACGTILEGGSEEEVEKLRKFGLYVGMIKGMLHRVDNKNGQSLMKEVEELRSLALEELKGFNDKKVGAIASLVECNFSYV